MMTGSYKILIGVTGILLIALQFPFRVVVETLERPINALHLKAERMLEKRS